MNLQQIEALITKGESQHLEFKKSTAQLKPAFETVCAFLNNNDKGGIILLGVTDKGQPVGQQVTDNTRQEIAREIKKIEPKPEIEVHYVDLTAEKQIIFIKVLYGKHIPYAYDGRAFERNQSSTERMTQHRYEQLIVNRGQLNHSWEKQPAYGYEIDDLDHEEIKSAIRDGIAKNRIGVEVLDYNIEHILTKLELIQHGHLINAAVVLFAKEVCPDYSQCMIRMARFRGNDNLGDFIDNQRTYGNAFKLVAAALAFTQRHLPIASYFEPNRMQRIDQPAVPNLALREALINALSHREYTTESSTVSLAVYDNRLEIWNAGELSKKLTIDDLKKRHNSVPRNKIIATVFYQRGLVEGWGTGTLRMAGYCRENGTPEPDFEEYSGGFSTAFNFKEAMSTAIQKPDQAWLEQLTPRQKEIIAILSTENAMSTHAIRQQMQDPPSERTLRYDLANLRDKGVISSVGTTKTTTWSIDIHQHK
jgi:ATP-dependent DNA helicase RecG